MCLLLIVGVQGAEGLSEELVRRPFAVVLGLLLYYIVVVVREHSGLMFLCLVKARDVCVAVDLYPVCVSQGLKTWLSIGVGLRCMNLASA